jgi:hypothetical protein
LAIENGGNVRCQAGFENFLGVGDPGRDAGNHLGIFKNLEGFVLVHGRILAQEREEV